MRRVAPSVIAREQLHELLAGGANRESHVVSVPGDRVHLAQRLGTVHPARAGGRHPNPTFVCGIGPLDARPPSTLRQTVLLCAGH